MVSPEFIGFMGEQLAGIQWWTGPIAGRRPREMFACGSGTTSRGDRPGSRRQHDAMEGGRRRPEASELRLSA